MDIKQLIAGILVLLILVGVGLMVAYANDLLPDDDVNETEYVNHTVAFKIANQEEYNITIYVHIDLNGTVLFNDNISLEGNTSEFVDIVEKIVNVPNGSVEYVRVTVTYDYDCGNDTCHNTTHVKFENMSSIHGYDFEFQLMYKADTNVLEGCLLAKDNEEYIENC